MMRSWWRELHPLDRLALEVAAAQATFTAVALLTPEARFKPLVAFVVGSLSGSIYGSWLAWLGFPRLARFFGRSR